MILHVYDDRARWMGKEPWDLDLRAFDLTPRGPYADEGRIRQGDALVRIEGPADLIIADIPYFGQCGGVYGDHPANMGDMDWPAYQAALARLARSCRKAQRAGGRTVIIAAAAFDYHEAGRREVIMLQIVDAFRRAGYEGVDAAFSTRRIQQHQGVRMACLNNKARERRLMLSDMLAVLCFEATDRTPDEAELHVAWAKASDQARAAFLATITGASS
jgi:ParB family chromosome partitioning protein